VDGEGTGAHDVDVASVAFFGKGNEAFDPLCVGSLGVIGIVHPAQGVAQAIQEFRRVLGR